MAKDRALVVQDYPSDRSFPAIEKSVCPECGGRMVSALSPDGNSLEEVCASCGYVPSELNLKIPSWRPTTKPTFYLGFGKGLGGTLNIYDAARILSKISRTDYEKRMSFIRARKAVSIFSREYPVEDRLTKRLLEAGKRLSESLGLDVQNNQSDPTDFSHMIGNDLGWNIRRLSSYLNSNGKRVNARKIVEALLYHVLYLHNPALCERFQDKWTFRTDDLLLVKTALESKNKKMNRLA